MRWDIFCTVIDNYGDIGVCWRLARQLVSEYGHEVRLWLDEPRALRALRGDLGDVCLQAPRQRVAGIEVRRWRPEARIDASVNASVDASAGAPGQAPAESSAADAASGHDWQAEDLPDAVIEAFACELPRALQETMRAARQRTGRQPVWVNLEYLSAEAWVDGCHGLASPQAGGLVKHFFFPGFSTATGGLLRETGAARQEPEALRERALRAALGPSIAVLLRPGALRVSLFCYANAALPGLLDPWVAHDQPLDCLVPEGFALQRACAALNRPLLAPGEAAEHGALRIIALPFVEQSRYDAILRGCSWNFVRGEDSFVRAQWTGMPLVWHIYPQEDDAHLQKLDAFLARYLEALPAPAADALRRLAHAWNTGGDCRSAWQACSHAFPTIAAHTQRWRDTLAAMPDLARQLTRFVEAHGNPAANGP